MPNIILMIIENFYWAIYYGIWSFKQIFSSMIVTKIKFKYINLFILCISVDVLTKYLRISTKI